MDVKIVDSRKRAMNIVCTIMLAFTYFACGLGVCAGIPYVTETLSRMYSETEISPYTADDLTALALETRAYTVENYGRGSQGGEDSANAYADFLFEKAQSSLSDSQVQDRWSREAVDVVERRDDFSSPSAAMDELASVSEQYALDEDAISHLDDVNDLLSRLQFPLLGVSILAVFCIMATIRMFGVKAASAPLLYSGVAVFIILLAIGVWALIDFNGFFASLHSLFFSAGSWTFPADSLLIEMYPEGFWVGMGAVWLCTSCLIGLLSIAFGSIIKSRMRKAQGASFNTKI